MWILATSLALAGAGARVLVLGPEPVQVELGPSMEREVLRRIARESATFCPSVDLFQAGRVQAGRSRAPTDRDGLDAALAEAVATPWSALDEDGWAEQADALLGWLGRLGFVDTPEERVLAFDLSVQVGRAAENSGRTTAPFYHWSDGQQVPTYWVAAAALASDAPDLLARLVDPDLHASVAWWVDAIGAGGVPRVQLGFDSGAHFDAEDFAATYDLRVDGLTMKPTAAGLVSRPVGRIDVDLRRADGFGPAMRLEAEALGSGLYFVLNAAQKAVDVALGEALDRDPHRAIAALEAEVAAWLDLYAALHPGEDVFVLQIAERGAAEGPRVWQFDPVLGRLIRILDPQTAIPAHATVHVAVGGLGTSAVDVPGGWVPHPVAVPFAMGAELHLGRWRVGAGVDAAVAVDASWRDRYPTEVRLGVTHDLVATDRDGDVVLVADESRWQTTPWARAGLAWGAQAHRGWGGWLGGRIGQVSLPRAAELALAGGANVPLPGEPRWLGGELGLTFDGVAGLRLPVGDSLWVQGTDPIPAAASRTRRVGLPQPTWSVRAGVVLGW